VNQDTITVSVKYKQLSFVVTVDVQCQGKMEQVGIVVCSQQKDGLGVRHAAKRQDNVVG
jgi:hypothetical protein